MNIDKLKSDLQTKGYTQFNLKDFNEDYYNELLPLKCNETQNLKHLMLNYRVDGKMIMKPTVSHLSKRCASFDVAKTEMDDIVNTMDLDTMFQNWYYCDYLELPLNNSIEKIKHNIARSLFSIDDSIKIKNFIGNIAFFHNDCFIVKHKDGTYQDRICAIMIYLNETYNINDGGILKLNNEEGVLPIFGNVAVISLDKNNGNPEHEVTKVTGGIGRYAITTFINYEVD
jgi:hypothetical protein